MRVTARVHVHMLLGANSLEPLLARLCGYTRDPGLVRVVCSDWLTCSVA